MKRELDYSTETGYTVKEALNYVGAFPYGKDGYQQTIEDRNASDETKTATRIRDAKTESMFWGGERVVTTFVDPLEA